MEKSNIKVTVILIIVSMAIATTLPLDSPLVYAIESPHNDLEKKCSDLERPDKLECLRKEVCLGSEDGRWDENEKRCIHSTEKEEK